MMAYYDQSYLDSISGYLKLVQESVDKEDWNAADSACALIIQDTMAMRARLPKHAVDTGQGDILF